MADWRDPEIVAVRAAMAMAAANPGAPAPSFADRRRGMEAWGSTFPPPDGHRLEAITLGGRPAERHVPKGGGGRQTILYLHGGGYCVGSPLSHRGLIAALSTAAAAEAVAPDYRMGPEDPFPAAVDDALAAYEDLLGQGVAPERIVIAGDSAGGGLTIATTLAAVRRGLPAPRGLFVISPWVNLAQEGASYAAKAASDPMITKRALDEVAGAYLGGADAGEALASPVKADLSGFPPTLIQVGSEEVLFSDAVALAERLGLAGVGATLEVWPEMIHVWHFFAPRLAAGRRAIERAGAWIRDLAD